MSTKRRQIRETRSTYRVHRKSNGAKSRRKKLALLWSQIENASEPLILKKNGEPIAVVIRYSDYRRLKLPKAWRHKESARVRKKLWENELVAMARDLDIQRELGLINEEFAQTESDGLDKL